MSKNNITEFVFDSHDLLAEDTDVQASAKEDDEVKKPEPELPKPKKYETIIKFIAGSVVGTDDRTSANGELPSLEKFGAELDKKQFVAFKVLCSSFLLYVLDKGTDGDTKLGKLLNASINSTCPDESNALRKKLLEIGANIELVMFITGPAGCGKSTCVSLAQEYCHKFCQAMGLPFDDNTFYFTSTTGSSAALFGGMTIHSAAHLIKRNITEEMCKVWESVIILIIDELSFFKVSDMNNLDRKLRRLKKCDKKYGGVIIVFSGDFHQLPPVKASDSEILYCCSDDATMWELSINCPIFLEISHRFKNDKLWGEIMNRFRNGEDTEDDRHEINKLYIGPDNEVTMNSNTAIACTTNKERNAVEHLAWQQYLQKHHPPVDSDDLPPDDVLFVECSVTQGKKKASPTIHDIIHSKIGDASIRTTSLPNKGAKVSPVLRFYPGSRHMVNTNGELETKKTANGSLCGCSKVRLKKSGNRIWKNWDGYKVWTVSINKVEYVDFKHYPKAPKGAQEIFRLKPTKNACVIDFPLTSGNHEITVKLGKLNVTQIPVNCDIATTGHKLQGMSLDFLNVNSWGYNVENWVYVVLSRARGRAGLSLNKMLDMKKKFKVSEKLLSFECRMKKREAEYLNTVHGM